MRILGISGSLRRDSHNTKLLRTAAELLPPSVELEIFDGLKAVEPYDEDDDQGAGPAGARRLREAIESADAVLIATPEYNSSLPGQLKNALDWASRPTSENALLGKPAAVVGASTGMFGAVWSHAETRKVLRASGARVIEEELPVGHADEAFSEDGSLADPELRERYSDIVDQLISEAEQAGAPESVAGFAARNSWGQARRSPSRTGRRTPSRSREAARASSPSSGLRTGSASTSGSSLRCRRRVGSTGEGIHASGTLPC